MMYIIALASFIFLLLAQLDYALLKCRVNKFPFSSKRFVEDHLVEWFKSIIAGLLLLILFDYYDNLNPSTAIIAGYMGPQILVNWFKRSRVNDAAA